MRTYSARDPVANPISYPTAKNAVFYRLAQICASRAPLGRF
jgi:hypothetical protein